MVFLPGDHVLDADITVTNVARFIMHGKSSSDSVATIVCNESLGLSFTRMVEFKIFSLAFTSCSRKYDLFPAITYALLLQSTQLAELVHCSFHDNPGSALVVINTNITVTGNNAFTHNRCESTSCIQGGGIVALNSNLIFTGNTTFHENFAVCCGGAIYASYKTSLNFNGATNFITNSAHGLGGAIYTSTNTVLNFNGTSNFIRNSAENGGGAICTSDNTVLKFSGASNFISNKAYDGGAICASTTSLHFTGTTNFSNNVVYDGGGAIFVNMNTNLTFNGTIRFNNNGDSENINKVCNGGGLFMGLGCTFHILPNTTVYWENNQARLGGAIFVLDSSPLSYCGFKKDIPIENCFFQIPDKNLSNIDVQLIFTNNSADVAGSVLYGGAIDNCKLTGLNSYSSSELFDMIFYIEDINATSSISSEALYICPCENNYLNCSKNRYSFRHVYPGEKFQVSVIAVGQRNGTVPKAVRSIASAGNLADNQYLQQASNTCTTLNYTVSSLSHEMSISLYAEDSPCFRFGYKLTIPLVINQPCPPGFNLSVSEKLCGCEPRLKKYTKNCNITNGLAQITRDSSQHFWVGYDNRSHELILHPHCPFDYCVNGTVVFPLNNTDIQCRYNRSGLLCGACKKGYSLVLGSHHCRKCTNLYLALLVPFALMGIALVLLLFVCKLTVATGVLSGLVFYSNIVGANCTIFLPVESINPFSVFIAWLNLDFGIETCFYDGLDAYTKTWLQFAFPLYIWVIVGFMILVSHYSHRFANLLGNNPVSVLATLILLSYTKIIRSLIISVYTTYLEYPTYNCTVWLYDANVNFLDGKHIPLFLVAVLVFLFLFLPYTLLLFFGQWLQAMSHWRLFSWVNSAKLKPFMDSYHAPYKAKHRYWPGLLLLLRFVLLLVFAFEFNPQQDRTSINLLTILVATGILVVWAWLNGGVYRNWCLDALEGSFVLNLIILVGATFYVKLSGGNQLAVGYTSVSIAFATFIGILAFQLANVTGISQCLKRTAVAIRNVHRAETEVEPQDIDFLPDRLVNPGQYEPPLFTPQKDTTAEPTEKEGLVQKGLTPVYTYGSTD